MTRILGIAIALISSASMVASAAGQKRDASKAKPPKPVTLVGCIQHAETGGQGFTLSEGKDSPVYRITGSDFRDYIGRRVEIVGGLAPRKLKISGGLLPSPNAAAQAGALDPAQAAVAAASGSAGPGTVELPEFRVKNVRPVTGSCED